MAKSPVKAAAPTAAANAAAEGTAVAQGTASTAPAQERPQGTDDALSTQQDGAGRSAEGSQGGEPASGESPGKTLPLSTAGVQPSQLKRPYVVGSVPIRHDGVLYHVGYEIELTEKEAERLRGFVVPMGLSKE